MSVAETNSLSTLEALVGQWTELRVRIADEEREWEERRRQMQAEVDLLQKEKTFLDAEISERSEHQATDQADQLNAERRKEQLDEALDALSPPLGRAEAELRTWPALLPPPLLERFETSFRRLPAGGDDAQRHSAAARLQLVLALYSEIETLRSGIHATREVIGVEGGAAREMDVLYIGLARAFAVSPDDAWAGIGVPTADGWIWTPRPEMAPQVRLAVQIYRRERTAGLVLLPLQVVEVGP